MREIQQKARPARTIYGCSFCSRVNVRKATMEKHERICYWNPDRECPMCDGSGVIVEHIYEGGSITSRCPACASAAAAMEAVQANEDRLADEFNKGSVH